MTGPVFVGRFEVGSPEWHQARAGALGGSEVAAACNLSTFESAFSLWHRKAGMTGPIEDNNELYWGRRLEPLLREEFARRHPEYIVESDLGMWRSGEHPYMLASPDALLYRHSGLPEKRSVPEIWEGKTARIRDNWGPDGSDDVPVYYRAQGLWNCMVWGAPRVHYGVLFAGSEYAEFTVEYDEMEGAILRERGRLFVQSLLDGVRPEIDGHERTYETVRELAPGIEDYDIELPGDIALPYLEAVKAYKEAKAAHRMHTARVADAIGDGRRGCWIGDPIARRQRKGNADPHLVFISEPREKQVITA